MGHRRSSFTIVAALGSAAALAAGAGPAGAAPKDDGKRVDSSTTDAFAATLTLEGASKGVKQHAGERTVRARKAGREYVSRGAPERGVASARGSFSCVYNHRRKGFVAYAPIAQGNSTGDYETHTVFHAYIQNRARKLVGPRGAYRSKQIETCAIGGVQGKDGNKITRYASHMALDAKKSKIIGWKWDEGHEESEANATLKFAVSKGPVSIGADLPVNPAYDLRGSHAGDEKAPSYFDGLGANQVNALWESSDTFRWQGSSEYQGNVGHGLWELRQSRPSPGVKIGWSLQYHCSHPYGIGC